MVSGGLEDCSRAARLVVRQKPHEPAYFRRMTSPTTTAPVAIPTRWTLDLVPDGLGIALTASIIKGGHNGAFHICS